MRDPDPFCTRLKKGYSFPPPIEVPCPMASQEMLQHGFSGADPSGGLYVDGYRVLPSGWVRLQVVPADATVLIDGFPVVIDQASGTSRSLGLLVGSQHVEVSKAGFQKYQSELEVK